MDIKVEMVVINCPLCGERRNSPLYREDPYQMVRCSNCKFIFANPRPTMDFLYDHYQRYFPEGEEEREAWRKMMKPVFTRAAQLILKYRERGRLLDVGTGFGFFLEEMRQRGWEVFGVEISEKAVTYAREVLGLTIYSGPFETLSLGEEEFDVISGFYVIEHLPEPMKFLRKCYTLLKPDGLLFLRYPHTTPIKTLLRFFGIENRLYDLPSHLSDFSPKLLQGALEKVGFHGVQHLIGGYTLPKPLGKRLASIFFGSLSEGVFYLSGRHFLLPGVSKTLLAFKGERP